MENGSTTQSSTPNTIAALADPSGGKVRNHQDSAVQQAVQHALLQLNANNPPSNQVVLKSVNKAQSQVICGTYWTLDVQIQSTQDGTTSTRKLRVWEPFSVEEKGASSSSL